MDLNTLDTTFPWVSKWSSRWCQRVAFNKKGLALTPNTTRVNLYAMTLGSFLFGSSTHRNRKKSRSLADTETIRKAFLLSAVTATRCTRKRLRMSRIFRSNFGAVIERRSVASCGCIIDHTKLRSGLILANYHVVWKVVYFWDINQWLILYGLNDSLLQLCLDHTVIFCENVWFMFESTE